MTNMKGTPFRWCRDYNPPLLNLPGKLTERGEMRTCPRSETHKPLYLAYVHQWKLLEFLWICADFSSVEFVWTYAKPLHAQGGVSAYVRRFLLCGVCVQVRKTASCTERSFCVCTQIKNWRSFCGYAQTTSLWSFCNRRQKSSRPLLGIWVSMQMNNFWSFCGYAQLLEREKHTIRRSSNTGVSATIRKKALATIRYLCIYTNETLLEFLRICTATGERKSDISSHDAQLIQYWGFCNSTQTLRIWTKYYLEIRKIAVCFLWLLLPPGHYRVTDEALLAETT